MTILKKPLNYAGRLFEKGENIRGHVPLDMIELLQDQGALDEVPSDEVEGKADVGVQDGNDQLKTLDELSEFLKTVEDVKAIQDLMNEEQAKGKPRAGAMKLLEARLKEIQDERV